MSYDPNNIFAKILRGEAPCIRIFEDDQTLVIMDIMPQSEGHVLVLTKEAAAQIFELSEQGAAACMRTARKAALAVKAALAPAGVILAQANGAAAGQTVPHLHVHVIPRREGQFLAMHAAKPADPAELRQIAERIRAAWPT
ncbi:HIT family protein [Pandoraea sp.]|uniref:HIT family protein n=1 Tax=Pandoraea sp. TaxID=1883445 RepID=UPI00120C1D9E|nr:HIT family protein [Pandoraea sp.]TAL52281.1 MAG: HIT family protein [Pandoraea sp.]TAM16091.1 MAG: HIT family protein [Pandoraea sp.]